MPNPTWLPYKAEWDNQFSYPVVSDSCDPMDCITADFPVHHQLQNLLKLMSIELVMPSNHLILCCPLLLLPSVLPNLRVFSNESLLCITVANVWSFSFIISPSSEYSGLISFRIDWFDLLAVQQCNPPFPFAAERNWFRGKLVVFCLVLIFYFVFRCLNLHTLIAVGAKRFR